jgi:hypothetical protein
MKIFTNFEYLFFPFFLIENLVYFCNIAVTVENFVRRTSGIKRKISLFIAKVHISIMKITIKKI